MPTLAQRSSGPDDPRRSLVLDALGEVDLVDLEGTPAEAIASGSVDGVVLDGHEAVAMATAHGWTCEWIGRVDPRDVLVAAGSDSPTLRALDVGVADRTGAIDDPVEVGSRLAELLIERGARSLAESHS